MGGGGGKSSSASGLPTADLGTFNTILSSLFKETNPTVGLLARNINSILRGHLFGKGTMPLVQEATGAARSAAANALTGEQGQLAQSGAARGGGAGNIISQLIGQGLQNVAQAPFGFAQQFLGMAPGFAQYPLGLLGTIGQTRAGTSSSQQYGAGLLTSGPGSGGGGQGTPSQ